VSTQAVTVVCSGPTIGRRFSGTATDGSYTSLNTTTGSAEFGFALQGKVINRIDGNYAAGSGVAVIRDRVSNSILRTVFLSLSANTSNTGTMIQPLMVTQNHILEVYTLAAGTTVLAFVHFKGNPNPELFDATIADNNTGELVSVANNTSLGTYFGQTMDAVQIQGSDGKIVQYGIVFNGDGGEIWAAQGGERLANQLGNVNLVMGPNMNVLVTRGMTLKATMQA
jgi:hypothetical protein